jgi:hypothetical protein
VDKESGLLSSHKFLATDISIFSLHMPNLVDVLELLSRRSQKP